MMVWDRREPWYLDNEEFTKAQIAQKWPNWSWTSNRHNDAPDGRRTLYYSAASYMIQENHESMMMTLYTFNLPKMYVVFGFLDNDRCIVRSNSMIEQLIGQLDSTKRTYQLCYRRHPEWWWGHFYRPEVWALIGLTILFIWSAKRERRHSITSFSKTIDR